MSNPLDTLANEAATTTSLEAEETGGAPPMPPAGVEAAALKPTLELDSRSHVESEPNGGAGEALHSETGLAGTGDAAMAAVDDRLDTQELSHTNGFVEDSQDKQQGNEVDYGRVAGLSGQFSEGEKVPPMSMDVEQPADRVEEQGEATLPAPGKEDSMSLSKLVSEDSPALQPQTNGHAQSSEAGPIQATAEFQQTVPEPASSLGQASEQETISKLPSSSTFEASPAPPSSQTVHEDAALPTIQADPPQSMDALPDAPAPLPSQLVNHSVNTSDIYHTSASSSIPSEQQSLPPPRSPFSSGELTLPAQTQQPQSTFADGVAPPLASPSIAKRPFEPDTSISDPRDYFGDNAVQEPQVKRQRMSPPADQVSAPSQLAEGLTDGEGEKDADADAEAEVDTSAAEPEIQFGTADMGEQQLQSNLQQQQQMNGEQGLGQQAPKVEGDMSMIDQSLDQSMNGNSFSYDPMQQSQAAASYDPSQSDQQYLPSNYGGQPSATSSMDNGLDGTPTGDFKPTQQELPPAPATMPKEQCRYALSILRTMKKKPEASPFLQPVDPVALGIPSYAQIITHPMDLSTVERKVQQSQYVDSEAFATDMRMIWNNCYTFNGPDNPISQWAKTLSILFEKQIQRMPTLASILAEQNQKRSASPNDLKKSKSLGASKSRRSSTAGGPRLSDSQKRQQAYEGEYDEYTQPGPSSARSQPGGGAANKKKGKAGPGQMMGGYGGQQQNGNINNEQLKFCKELIKELFKKNHSAFAYPFYEPVDYMALGIPDYPKVIRRPMDLGSMKRKIESGQYPNAAQFEGDFKLLIQNCFTYNPPMTPVHKMGDQLQAVFYDRWQHLPQDQGYGGYGGGGGNYYNDDNQFDSEQINLMQRQLELLTGNLEMLRSKAMMQQSRGPRGYGPGPGNSMGMQMQMPMQMQMQQNPYQQQMAQQPQQMQQPMHSPMQMSPPLAAAPPQPKAPRPPPAPRQPKAPAKRKTSGSFSSSLPSASAQAAAPPKPRTTKRSSMAGRADVDYAPPPRGGRADSDYEDEEIEGNVTFDMKRELAEKIQEFDGPKLDKVVEIIRNSAPELLGDDNKEIELDIDMLDQRTLLKLYEYVVHPVGRGRQLKPKKNKVKGRNRGVDEVAEEERINALQAQLDAMSGSVANAAAAAGVPVPDMPMPAQGGGNRAADVASSSSEDEDDGSESESDGFAPSPQ